MSARRVLSSLTVVAVTAALAVYGTDLFSGGGHPEVSGESITLGAQGTTLVCPAPVALAGEVLDPGSSRSATAGDEEFGSTPVAPQSIVQAALFGAQTTTTFESFAGAGDAETTRTLQGADPSAQLSLDGVTSATIVRSVASGTQDAAAYASAASVTAAGDLRGMAAAACQEPGVTQWLVGGGTTLGTTTELVLSNPSRTPATVTLDLWGAGGELTLAGPSTYLVPPGGQVTTLLGGLAAEQNRLVARVTASGALVTAYLQHTVLDGLTPGGVDYVTAGAEPATAQVLTGVTVEASAVTDADVALLRLLAPQDGGTATIRVLGADGQQVLRGAESVELAAGAVADVSLAGLPAGTYTVVVQADTAVVAGAQMTRTGTADADQPMIGTPKDRAWVAARHDRSPAGVAVLPAGTQALVVLTALPAEIDGADGLDVAADVPIVYPEAEAEVPADAELSADDAAAIDAATDPATDPDPVPLADGWTPAPRGELRAYGADGSLVGTQAISLAPGQTLVVDPTTFSSGAPVSAVAVVATPETDAAGTGLTLDWSVLLSAPHVPGSIAVVQPTSPAASTGSVVVRRSAAVGLPLH